MLIDLPTPILFMSCTLSRAWLQKAKFAHTRPRVHAHGNAVAMASLDKRRTRKCLPRTITPQSRQVCTYMVLACRRNQIGEAKDLSSTRPKPTETRPSTTHDVTAHSSRRVIDQSQCTHAQPDDRGTRAIADDAVVDKKATYTHRLCSQATSATHKA